MNRTTAGRIVDRTPGRTSAARPAEPSPSRTTASRPIADAPSDPPYGWAGRARQRGAVLAVSLIFLLLLSIVAVSLMRSGQLEVLMAGNAQARLGAYELAEAVTESTLANWEDNLDTEAIVCTPGHPDPDGDCDRSDLVWDNRLNPAHASALAPVDKATVTARAKPLNDGQPACVPAYVTGVAHGTWAFFFDVEGTFDNTDERQGTSQINRGAVVVNPVSADCFSNPPQGNLDNFAHVPTE